MGQPPDQQQANAIEQSGTRGRRRQAIGADDEEPLLGREARQRLGGRSDAQQDPAGDQHERDREVRDDAAHHQEDGADQKPDERPLRSSRRPRRDDGGEDGSPQAEPRRQPPT
jgi:hypothetical protein